MRPAALACASLCLLSSASAGEKPRWKKVDVNVESPYEAVGVADFDGDGKLDIFSGDSWYQAPRWKRFKVREVAPSPNPKYHEDFGDMPLDVNGDGKPDLVTCSFFGKLLGWVEHPGDPRKPWTTHEIERPGASEACRLIDVNGDGKLDLLPNTNNMIVWYELTAQKPEPRWERRLVAKEGAGHGVGAGDINSDGRLDFIGPKGWYEQPKDPAQPWTFHAEFNLGAAGIMILGRDVDGDGLTDVVWGMGHAYGLFWLQQKREEGDKRAWSRQEIDTGFSQAHVLLWADLDGKGEPALVTGKRIYSHEVEAGATDAPVIYAFRFDRKQGKWNRETIYEGQPAKNAPEKAQDRAALRDFPRGTAGTGLHVEAVDIDRDGDLDLVCPGKSGLYLFENLRIIGKQRTK